MKKVYFEVETFNVNFEGIGELASKNELEELICLGYSPIENELLELKDGIYWWVDESIIGGDFCGYILIKKIEINNYKKVLA